MLPWMKKKEQSNSGLMVKIRPSDHPEEQSEDSALEQAAKEVLSAIEAKDPKSLANALKVMCKMIDLEPHAEGPHEEME